MVEARGSGNEKRKATLEKKAAEKKKFSRARK
jgi:hypothetical protein